MKIRILKSLRRFLKILNQKDIQIEMCIMFSNAAYNGMRLKKSPSKVIREAKPKVQIKRL